MDQLFKPARTVGLMLAALLSPLAPTWAAPSFDLSSGEYVPDEILVRFKDASIRTSLISGRSGEEIETLEQAGLSRIRLREGQSVEDAIAEYGGDSNVEHVQPNFIYKLQAMPNDALFGQMWGLRNTGQRVASNPPTLTGDLISTNNPGTAGMDMGLERAWDVITDCSSATVGVVDSGISYNHEDIAANLWADATGNHGRNFVDMNNDPLDLNGHGTHVAGTIGAVGNNGLGTTGLCWKAKIMSLRTCNAAGSCTTSANVSAVDFAIANQAKVLNMSLGGRGFDQAFSDAILRASNSDIVVVVAAGNENTNNDVTPSYPCNFPHPNVICVAALDQSYALASFSNYGASSVHVAGPGVNVVSTWAGSSTASDDDFHTSPWTAVPASGGWVYQHRTIQGQAVDLLVDPSTYPSGTFHSNDLVYKQFTFGAAQAALLDIAGQVTLGAGNTLDVNGRVGGGNPFSGGTRILRTTGSTQRVVAFPTLDISQCAGMTCSFGFQLTGAPPATGGAGIVDFSITTLQLNNVTYKIEAGTSMATPHVAGLATMLRAYNPSYTVADVVNAIKGGGTSVPALATKTTTGKAANAFGSLTYINAPTGVTATVSH